jgi:hypothetical protein
MNYVRQPAEGEKKTSQNASFSPSVVESNLQISKLAHYQISTLSIFT